MECDSDAPLSHKHLNPQQQAHSVNRRFLSGAYHSQVLSPACIRRSTWTLLTQPVLLCTTQTLASSDCHVTLNLRAT